MTGRVDWGVENALESNTVSCQALESLLEDGLSTGSLARDVVLFPLNGSVDVLEDLLDGVGDFCTNTITGDECDSVDSAVLGWQSLGNSGETSSQSRG